MEIFFTLLYASFIGFYNIFKKQSTKKSSEATILIMFTTIAFILSLIWIPFGIAIPLKFVLIFALKGLLLTTSWFIILKVLKSADISLVTITNVISAVITFILGIIIFKESTTIMQIIGSILVIGGVACINFTSKKSDGKITYLQFALLLLSALITTSSNIIDKYTTTSLTSFQVQFWFLFFVFIFSWIFFGFECIKNKKFLISKIDLKNYWIYLVGLFLFVGDFFLFQAYKVPGSKMITISILSKMKVLITTTAGILIFKEKSIIPKFVFSIIVVIGAVLISIF